MKSLSSRVPHTWRSHVWGAQSARAAAPIAFIVIAAAILLRFPPDQYAFYPPCPIHSLFGVLCPGCGATRALAALLHGNITEALRLNALTTALLTPIALAYAVVWYTRLLARKPLRLPQPPPAAIYTALAITTIFTITRNL